MSILVKERDYDDVESIRTSRTNGRGTRTIRRYHYPADDYDDDVNEQVDRIVIREKTRLHSPERTNEHIEIRRYDRSRDRDWDRESVHSARSHHTHRTHHSHHSHHPHHDDVEQIRITERTRDSTGPPEVRREINITTERPARSHRSRSSSSSSSSSSGPSTHTTKTVLVEKEMEVARPRSPETVPYTLERYTRSTSDGRPEHYHHHHQQQPMPIIIRSEAAPAAQPIIIRENSSPREIVIRQEFVQPPQQQLVQRPREEERQLTRRDDDYYYERHVRKERPGRRRNGDYYEEDETRRSRRGRDQYSDDEIEHRRRRRVTSYSRSRSGSSDSHHKRNILTGVVGGLVAGELVRHNRKKQGEAPGSRIANIAGYGALGGVGAEAVQRLRHWEQERSRSRSHSRHRSRSRARSRSRHIGPIRVRSLSRGETLLAGAAGLAAIGAAAYVARQRKTEVVQNTTVIEEGGSTRRGRSHHRDSSTHVANSIETETVQTNPKHRNQRVAQAGVVGAALGALAKSRSRSRKGGRGRSKSKVREGLPIVAAGLGSAAVAGLYEKHKANQETKRMRSTSRSGSHARSRSGGPKSRQIDDDIEYGDGDIYSDDREDHHSRRHSRSRSRGRRHSSSPDTRHRSRSRSRNLGTAAIAAGAVGAAGYAAHEASKRREERRAERERRRAEAAALANQSTPSMATYPESVATSNYYPHTNSFAAPPPIHGPPSPGYIDPAYTNQQAYANQQQYAAPLPRAYNPADYGPTSGPTLPPEDHRYASQAEQYPAPLARDMRDRSRSRSRSRPRDDSRPGPSHVSDITQSNHSDLNHDDGLATPRGVSPMPNQSNISSALNPPSTTGKTVQFADEPQSFSDTELDRPSSRRAAASDHQPRRRSGKRAESPASDGSNETVDLPERFDSQGQPIRKDSVADAVEAFLLGTFGNSRHAAGLDQQQRQPQQRRRRSSDSYVRTGGPYGNRRDDRYR